MTGVIKKTFEIIQKIIFEACIIFYLVGILLRIVIYIVGCAFELIACIPIDTMHILIELKYGIENKHSFKRIVRNALKWICNSIEDFSEAIIDSLYEFDKVLFKAYNSIKDDWNK